MFHSLFLTVNIIITTKVFINFLSIKLLTNGKSFLITFEDRDKTKIRKDKEVIKDFKSLNNSSVKTFFTFF